MLGRHGLFPCLGYDDSVCLDCTHICNTNKKELLEYVQDEFAEPCLTFLHIYLMFLLHREGGSET